MGENNAASYEDLYVGDPDGFRWLDSINCRDFSEADFFVEAGHTLSDAVRVACRTCPVRRQCCIYAYNRRYFAGYFAGMSPGKRRKLSLEDALDLIERESGREIA